jgi:hypothetical protein
LKRNRILGIVQTDVSIWWKCFQGKVLPGDRKLETTVKRTTAKTRVQLLAQFIRLPSAD